jgi:hypothetical protein
MSGRVKLRFTQTSSNLNAVVSGIFFAGATPSGPNATFLAVDTATAGIWKSVYGAEGYTVVEDSSLKPTYATVTPISASSYIWSPSSTDVRALQKGGVASDRIAATWYSPTFFDVDLNITDQSVHKLAVYCVDWDYLGRAQKVEVLDAATNAVLDTRTLSNFGIGVYLIWNVSGHIKLRFTQTSTNLNAVVSGIFFGDGTVSTGPSATFITTDTTTSGNWKSVYGNDGYTVIEDSALKPSYATVTPMSAGSYIWSSSTGDTRALQRGAGSDRIAATWYSGTFFDVYLNITDESPHQIAVYCLDWDFLGRAQKVDVLNAATNAVLDSRSISAFGTGVYLIWNVSGGVKLRFTQTSSDLNAVVSGIFFQQSTSRPKIK